MEHSQNLAQFGETHCEKLCNSTTSYITSRGGFVQTAGDARCEGLCNERYYMNTTISSSETGLFPALLDSWCEIAFDASNPCSG